MPKVKRATARCRRPPGAQAAPCCYCSLMHFLALSIWIVAMATMVETRGGRRCETYVMLQAKARGSVTRALRVAVRAVIRGQDILVLRHQLSQ